MENISDDSLYNDIQLEVQIYSNHNLLIFTFYYMYDICQISLWYKMETHLAIFKEIFSYRGSDVQTRKHAAWISYNSLRITIRKFDSCCLNSTIHSIIL